MKPAKQLSSTPDTDDVSSALHLFGESLIAEVQRINPEGSQAMQIGDYDIKYRRGRNTGEEEDT